MIFAYSARDPMGRTVEGELDAASAEQAARELTGRALTVRWIRPVAGTARTSTSFSSAAPSPDAAGEAGSGFPAAEGEGPGEEDEVVAGQKSGCSPWSIVIFLVLLSQILRAC